MSLASILVVDDEPDIRSLLNDILLDEGYSVECAKDGTSARAIQKAQSFDLILLDIWMPDIDGISLLREWKTEASLLAPVIMISGHGTVETAVEATRLGAYDFIEKPISLAKLLLIIQRALEAGKLKKENAGLQQRLNPTHAPIGKSKCMVELRHKLDKVAQHDGWVLLTGEQGVGKESIARYLHSQSSRQQEPFLGINLGSLSNEAAMQALYGSPDSSSGLFEDVGSGTLLLEQINRLDRDTQRQLSHSLTQRSYTQIGGTTQLPINARIVTTSDIALDTAVANSQFRGDLFYLLNILPLAVPSLRERGEDIPELLEFYIDYYNRDAHLPYRKFDVAAQNRLRNHSWPGNINELRNLVQRLLVLGDNEIISKRDIEQTLDPMETADTPPGQKPKYWDLPLREARESFERDYLIYQLQQTQGSVGKLAKVSGMERTHIYRKLRALGIDPKDINTHS